LCFLQVTASGLFHCTLPASRSRLPRVSR
jgi:hypothetical protein